MVRVSVRYLMEDGKYYLQVADEKYRKAAKRRRYFNKALAKCNAGKKMDNLTVELKRAQKAQMESMYYVELKEKDIPEGVQIRPMYHAVENIRMVSTQRYEALLNILQEKLRSKAERQEAEAAEKR